MSKRKKYKFNCGWCGNIFIQEVGTYNKVTSQVKCANCYNFLKSDSGKLIEVDKK